MFLNKSVLFFVSIFLKARKMALKFILNPIYFWINLQSYVHIECTHTVLYYAIFNFTNTKKKLETKVNLPWAMRLWVPCPHSGPAGRQPLKVEKTWSQKSSQLHSNHSSHTCCLSDLR